MVLPLLKGIGVLVTGFSCALSMKVGRGYRRTPKSLAIGYYSQTVKAVTSDFDDLFEKIGERAAELEELFTFYRGNR